MATTKIETLPTRNVKAALLELHAQKRAELVEFDRQTRFREMQALNRRSGSPVDEPEVYPTEPLVFVAEEDFLERVNRRQTVKTDMVEWYYRLKGARLKTKTAEDFKRKVLQKCRQGHIDIYASMNGRSGVYSPSHWENPLDAAGYY